MSEQRCYLGIDTSGQSTGVAMVCAEQVRADFTTPGLRHSDVILGLVERALRQADVKVTELAGIGVTIGPGTFTGLRVGSSTAKGLALPFGIPVKGVSTLLALALTDSAAGRLPDAPRLVVIDARKEQVYAGLYRGNRVVWGPTVVRPDELPGAIESAVADCRVMVVCGDAAAMCCPVLTGARSDCSPSDVVSPSAVVVARLARERIEREGGDDIAALCPEYLRRTDAELSRAGAPIRNGGGV